ncbi:MAG: hypothetical protein IID32_03420 [Planctomycetes bacterium]|nr:hypothetical protein [Planctomycetota bacterium]
MVLIGIIQISVSWGLGLIVPDKGGGFGMFSHIDGAYTRYAYVVLITDQGTMGELVTAESKKQLWLLKCMKNNPTEARMVNMARILGLRWQDQRDRDLNKQKQSKNPAQVIVIPEFKQIRLEIWSTDFSSNTLTTKLKPLKTITINWPKGKLLNTTTPSTKGGSP